jgi:hypothetical protein
MKTQHTERESIASFKTRFDYQVKANLEAGVPEATESTRALEFFFDAEGFFITIVALPRLTDAPMPALTSSVQKYNAGVYFCTDEVSAGMGASVRRGNATLS